jgi:ketosteroid isomerase-like protein
MSQEDVEVVRRIWDLTMEGIEKGDPAAGFNAAYDQGLISADSTFTPAPEVPGSQTYVGRDGFAEFLRAWTDEFADWKMRPDELLDAGDERVVAIVRQLATGRGSGATVELLFAVVYTLKDGQVIDRRHYLEPHEALEAAGLRE